MGRLVNFFLAKKLVEASATTAEYSETRVKKRMEKGTVTAKPDFWTHALAQHENETLNYNQMKANADMFMQGGSETTGTMLSGMMYNFMLNPEKAKKASDEVRMAFTSEDQMTMESMARLKYLNACFEESMRIYPSVPIGPPLLCVSAGTVCGEVIPVGTRVSVGVLGAYRSPLNFKNPKKFVPERWIEGTPEFSEYSTDRKEVFQPFSIGTRNCIGKALAYHELRIIACKMLWHFDFELAEENRDNWFDQKCFWALWSKPPLYLRAKPVRAAQV